jgi:hypothetical protein
MSGICSSIGQVRNGYSSYFGDHSEELGVDGRIILKWILGIQSVTV